ncbi:hypothetical protein Q3G72_021579 [Acer saccharum]|nr:hypothetical protein Q3G72_021579 [Acer saccharum]
MGRYSRFIAMYATLAIRDVDCCLIPKSQFYLEGPGGHMVIVIAEGAGQCKHTMDQQDASTKLFQNADLCIYQKIKEHLAKRQKMATNLKYIDPTYMIHAIQAMQCIR